ncbi:MAG: tryptophan-rich sensory protein [Anaerolineae bacterium]
MSRDRVRQITVIVATLAQIFLNSFTQASRNTADIADSFPNFFVPAGITFAVWGPLFLGTIVYAVYQALPAQTTRPIHRRVGWWAASAVAMNGLWPLAYGNAGLYNTPDFQPALILVSLGIIVWGLISLGVVFVTLRRMELSTTDEWLVRVPWYGLFAWITVATIANATVALIGLGWETTDNGAFWSALIIAVATVITSGVILYSRGGVGTGAYVAVIVWALIGIFMGNNDQSTLVGAVSLIAAAVVVLVALYRFINRNGEPESSRPAMTTA